jgi:hypothetical protein
VSVETQDRLLDLFSPTAGEVAIHADASEPDLFKNPQRCGIVRGCAGEQWAFSGRGEEDLERRTGDTKLVSNAWLGANQADVHLDEEADPMAVAKKPLVGALLALLILLPASS